LNSLLAEIHGLEEEVLSEEWWGQGLIKLGVPGLPALSEGNDSSPNLIRLSGSEPPRVGRPCLLFLISDTDFFFVLTLDFLQGGQAWCLP
jgi:hypothetical protein